LSSSDPGASGNRSGRLDEFPSVPPGCVTGIGSLPFAGAEEAVAFVERASPLLPFWPQLPGRSSAESALTQFLGSAAELAVPRGVAPGLAVEPGHSAAFLALLRDGAAELSPEAASGFFAFEEALLRNEMDSALGLKGQITGPVTLATYIHDGEEAYAEDGERTAILAAFLARAAAWQVRKLKRFGKPVLLFVDEPGLVTSGQGILESRQRHLVGALSDLFDAIRDAGGFAGLHCCGVFPYGILRRARPDVVSFDALGGLESFFASPDVHAHLGSGGRVAYGLVPTRPDPRLHTAEALFERWRTAAATFASPFATSELARSALITATCGIARGDEASARASFTLAGSLGHLFESAAS